MLAVTVPKDWGGYLVLLLVSAGAVGYTLLLARRAWILASMGRAAIRLHLASLLGLLCGLVATAIVGFYISISWLEGWGAANAIWSAHRWPVMLVIVCGFAFTWTDPDRQPSAVDRVRTAYGRAHPWHWRVGFLVAAAMWGILPPLAALPFPAGFVGFLAWVLLMLSGFAYALWWWSRRGRIEEIADGERVVYLPTYVVHPAFHGALWGTVTVALLWLTYAQHRTGL